MTDISKFVITDSICTLTSNLISQTGVLHGFTTRKGGNSRPPLDSLNLGFNRPEPREIIESNYHALCDACGVDYSSLVLVNYVHGTNVKAVTAADCGRGICKGKEPLPPCDGIVTNDPNVTLFTLHADCAALFVVDPVKKAIGLAHAGWRGVFGRMGQKLADKLSECYGSDPKDLVAAISPCICKNCYEVSLELAQSFADEFGKECAVFNHKNPEKAYIDIMLAAYKGFCDAGVPCSNISKMDFCTYEHSELFYSYRRSGKDKTGAMGAFLSLRGKK